MPRFRSIVLLLAALLGPAGCAGASPPSAATMYDLVVLHTNDVHSNYSGFDAENRICRQPLCQGGSGGLLRAKQAVDAIRRRRPNVILLDAGDQFQGTLFFSLYKEDMPAFALNALGYDAMCPGNHEFDDGCERFLRFSQKTDAPLLAANLALPGSPIAPWTILERGGRKIGVIGLAAPDAPASSSPCAEAAFSNPRTALQNAANELQARGVNIIIALTHLGLNQDIALAERVDGVDIIVGGHTHSLLSNSAPEADGPYPIVRTAPSGQPVLVVSAAHAGAYLGQLIARFDAQGAPVSWTGGPIRLEAAALAALDAGEPDAAVRKKLEAWSAGVRDMLETPLGYINAPGLQPGAFERDVRLCREQECLSADIAADAIKAHAGADMALINGGAVRYSLSAGPVSMGDVLTMLPFDDRVMVASLSGKTLLAALEYGLSGLEDQKGRFLQVAGLRYAFDPEQPAGQRLISADALDPDGRWRPIEETRSYVVATSDYLARGGDGYALFQNLDWTGPGEKLSDIVRRFLTRNSPLTVTPENRRIVVFKKEKEQ